MASRPQKGVPEDILALTVAAAFRSLLTGAGRDPCTIWVSVWSVDGLLCAPQCVLSAVPELSTLVSLCSL